MQKFNKWDSKLAKLIKISFLKFNKIYGYKILTLIINKIELCKMKCNKSLLIK
ncbi:putative transposase [Spiroplasma citri]|nr:putative transposase [Spiroplasma citri]